MGCRRGYDVSDICWAMLDAGLFGSAITTIKLLCHPNQVVFRRGSLLWSRAPLQKLEWRTSMIIPPSQFIRRISIITITKESIYACKPAEITVNYGFSNPARAPFPRLAISPPVHAHACVHAGPQQHVLPVFLPESTLAEWAALVTNLRRHFFWEKIKS